MKNINFTKARETFKRSLYKRGIIALNSCFLENSFFFSCFFYDANARGIANTKPDIYQIYYQQLQLSCIYSCHF